MDDKELEKKSEVPSLIFGLLIMLLVSSGTVSNRGDENIFFWGLGVIVILGGAFISGMVAYWLIFSLGNELLQDKSKHITIIAAVFIVIVLVWAGTNGYGDQPLFVLP